MPIGAHALLSFLAEPLKQLSENPDTLVEYVSENLKEFQDWSEYYSCDATYRKWLKIEIENADVPDFELSSEEKQRSITAAEETLNMSLILLQSKYFDYVILCTVNKRTLRPWKIINWQEEKSLGWFHLKILYMSQPKLYTLNCMPLQFCASLRVNVSISASNNYCIEVVLRCFAVEGDGLGTHDLNDGGVLGTVMAAGFKGELTRFQAGVAMELCRLDAWYSSKEGSLEGPATYIVRGLCRRCCLPELILWCMQVSISLVELGNQIENHDELIELVTCSETGFLHLFSQQQLQEFLLFERENAICKMELEEPSC